MRSELESSSSEVGGSDYVFGTDSMIWKINRRMCPLIYGPTTAILQAAHPRVAQGVVDHSDFETDPIGRLVRTIEAVTGIWFGTVAEAEQVRKGMAAMHSRVKGDVFEGIDGRSRYAASERDLLLWVVATLVDGSVKAYELVWPRLALSEKDQFYIEMRKFGTYFGLKENFGPQNWTEFETYYQAELHSEQMGAHPICREVALGVAKPQKPLIMKLANFITNFVSIETMPPHIRQRLGFSSTRWTRFSWRVFRAVVAVCFRVLPNRLTYYPIAYRRRSRWFSR